jgi:hypothetical protein
MKKADNFNPIKWLVENKITTQSRMNEEQGNITTDDDMEKVTLKTEAGIVEIGNIFDENGAIPGEISIYAIDNSPQGYTGIKISDLQKLISAYNQAEWSEGKI